LIVIADSSPLLALVNIECINVLPVLFQQVVVPPTVVEELKRPKRPAAVRGFINAPPPWIVVRTPGAVESIPNLHPGECEAIALAAELGADLLLMDEQHGRSAARARKLNVTGTVGVLERAAEQRLLDLATAFDRLRRTDFWIDHRILEARLRQFHSRHPGTR
jgi:predicted nucleic acid-binding protein